jgi:hypothetical protein
VGQYFVVRVVSYCWPNPLELRPLNVRARHEATQLETLGPADDIKSRFANRWRR